MMFLAPKTLMYSLSIEILFSFLILNLKILQKVWNKCVRFGGHVDIQVSYKISWLQVPKGPNFAQSTLLSRGAILRQLWTEHGLECLGVKLVPHMSHAKAITIYDAIH